MYLTAQIFIPTLFPSECLNALVLDITCHPTVVTAIRGGLNQNTMQHALADITFGFAGTKLATAAAVHVYLVHGHCQAGIPSLGNVQ